MSIDEAAAFLRGLELTERERQIAERVLKEINERLKFLLDVGLDYLSLSRPTASLSGGEAQRIRLATQIGSGLVGVLYVLDEPSIGLHQRDNRRLIETLVRLRDLGNTLIVVEHDEDTIKTADWAVDIGPGAGEHGGYVVHSGSVADLLTHPDSITGAYLSGRRSIPLPATRRPRVEGPRDHRAQRGRAQPAERHRDLPDGPADRGHRGVGVRQVHAGQRHPLHGPGQADLQRPGRAGPAPLDHRGGRDRQDHPRRPVADRAYAAVQPGHLHRSLRPHAPAVRGDAGGQGARLPAGPVLLQRQGRPLRELHRRRHDQDRDELPARRLRALRGLPRRPVQPGDPGGALQGQVDLGDPGHGRSRRRPSSSRPSRRSTGTSRPWSRSAWATCASASRRRRCPAARRSG